MNPRQSLLPEALRIPAPPYVNPFFWWAIGLGVLCLLGRVEIKLIEDIGVFAMINIGFSTENKSKRASDALLRKRSVI
ncbi:MAG: hypothetical protein AAGM67_11690, partial [Bacteroidota bacterium]